MRWIVDAMNVIGSRPDGWWRDRHAAMTGLVERLERWAVARDADVTVVFEAPPVPAIGSGSVRITHAPSASAGSADDEIARLVGTDTDPGNLTVVTSDRGLTERVTAAGASVYPASRFRAEIDDVR